MFAKGEIDATCEACGAVNVVSYTDYPERDRWSVNCAGCGEVLMSGKGTRDYQAARLKDVPK